MARETQGTILFADVCDSTGLYERVGDDRAHALVGDLIEGLQSIVAAHGGDLVRSKGDDVLCTFPSADAGLEATCEMLALSGAGEVAIHVGLHWGPFVHARGDIFGDAVNLAARLLALATPGELIASEDLCDRLAAGNAGRLRRLGKQRLKGKVEPVALFSLLSGAARTSAVATAAVGARGVPTGLAPTLRVRVRYGSRELEAGEGASLSIGRSESCDCVVANESVSRRHATISVNGGIVTIADSSSTGTYVAAQGQPAVMLRRNAVTLVASGTIALGAPAEAPATPLVEYVVETVRPGD